MSEKKRFSIKCSCGVVICNHDDVELVKNKSNNRTIMIFKKKCESLKKLTLSLDDDFRYANSKIFRCTCSKKVAFENRKGTVLIDFFATEVMLSDGRVIKTIDFLKSLSKKTENHAFGKSKQKRTPCLFGKRSTADFSGRKYRRRNDQRRFGGERSRRGSHESSLFSNLFFLENDLNKLRKTMRTGKVSDALESIKKNSSFEKKVLNSEAVQSFRKDAVVTILEILQIAIDRTISDPKKLVENTLLESRFVKEGLSVYIRSDYFKMLFSVTRLCKFLKVCLKLSPEKTVCNCPLDDFEKILLPSFSEEEIVREIIEWKIKVEEKRGEEEESEEVEGEEEEEEEEDWEYEMASIIPTREDFVISDKKSKLPPKNTFYYRTPKEYIKTHFKLIREDFIGPFKEGFQKWVNFCSGKEKDFDFRDMNVFTNVRFYRYQISKFGEYEILAQFDVPSNTMKGKLKKRSYSTYKSSKALMRNSLVVLFPSSFEVQNNNTNVEEEEEEDQEEERKRFIDPIVCTVVSNEEIDKQRVTLRPYDTKNYEKLDLRSSESSQNMNYLMIESPVFFTAYESVLKSLQEKEAIPFPKVLLEGCNELNTPPKYIQEHPRLNFSKIKKKSPLEEEEEEEAGEEEEEDALMRRIMRSLPPHLHSEIKKEDVDESNIIENCLTSWPKTDSTCLNDSENEGMMEVFRRKLALIQGGPGTGKTYIGRKIAEVMRDNPNHPSPIVCITYTNHALDAFLEPMLRQFPRMVRIGTRTRSTNAKYMRRQMKELMKPMNRRYSSKFGGDSYEINRLLIDNSREIKLLRGRVDRLSFFRFQFREWKSLIDGYYQHLEKKKKRNDGRFGSKYLFEPFIQVILDSFRNEFDPVERKYFPEDVVLEKQILENLWLSGVSKREAVSNWKELIRKKLKKNSLRNLKRREKRKKRQERLRELKEKKEKEELMIKKKKEEENMLKKQKEREEYEKKRKQKEMIWEKEKKEMKKKLEQAKKKNEKKKELSFVRMVNKKKKNPKKTEEEEEEEQKEEVEEAVDVDLGWNEEDDDEELEMDPLQMRKRKLTFDRFTKSLVEITTSSRSEKKSDDEEDEEPEVEGEDSDEEKEIIEQEIGENSESEEEEEKGSEEKEEKGEIKKIEETVEKTKENEREEEEKGEKSEEKKEGSHQQEKEEQKGVKQAEEVEGEEEEEEEEEDVKVEEEDWDWKEQLNDLKYIESKKYGTQEDIIDPEVFKREKEMERNKEEEERAQVLKFLQVFDDDDEEDGGGDDDELYQQVETNFNKYMESLVQTILRSCPNPWSVPTREGRIKVLLGLHKRFQRKIRVEEIRSFKRFEELYEARRGYKLKLELQILRSADIVGLTSTMASIRRRLLRELNAKIYIIEEAAELLEGQILACIPKDVEHVILIGDHFQLKPKFNMMELKDCNIDVSMFERMDKIKVSVNSLLIQQRMRPEISYFMKYFFYPKMKDHPSVEKYPHVVGHHFNVQFISHNEPESTSRNSRSKFNHFEAQFVVNHALYILKHQVYKPAQITILTPYKGQLFVIKQLMRDIENKHRHQHQQLSTTRRGGTRRRLSLFEGLRVETVDDFQGEENDIVLVSLVRSKTRFDNKKENIGFLKIQNRIIVLMSRARIGIYVYGNSNLMKSRSGDWDRILEVLEEQRKLREYLFIRCQNHHDVVKKIQHPNEFKSFRCSRDCGFDFPLCEHKCKRKCHMYTNHPKCSSICGQKIDKCGHSCKKICHEQPDGSLSSPCDCREVVIHSFEKCGHQVRIECSRRFERRLKCEEVILHNFGCGHHMRVKCCEKDNAACQKVVPLLLTCSHHSTKKCFEEISSDEMLRRRNLCVEKVEFSLVCGHTKMRKCNQDENMLLLFTKCVRLCKKKMPCGHICHGRCEDCRKNGHHQKCQTKVREECVKCGGSIERDCASPSICRNRCGVMMKCKHRCSNHCSSCEGRHKCLNTCSRIRICGHECQGGHACGGDEKCNRCVGQGSIFRCSHGKKCSRRNNSSCSDLYHYCRGIKFCMHGYTMNEHCSVCHNQSQYQWYKRGGGYDVGRSTVVDHGKVRYNCYYTKCTNSCPHRKCTRLCHQTCNVSPCWFRCQKRLQCKHRCTGFCGEICPPCLHCQAIRSTKRRNNNMGERRWVCGLSGEPYSPNKMKEDCVVMLQCSHIFWSRALDQEFMKFTSDVFKRCPKCRTRLTDFRCYRYEKSIKLSFYTMNNLNSIRILEDQQKNFLTQLGFRNEKKDRELDLKIRKFITPLIERGILGLYLPETKNNNNNYVEVMRVSNTIMDEFVKFEREFFSETGIDITRRLSVHLRRLNELTKISVSVFIAEVLHHLLISKENEKRRRIWDVEFRVMKTVQYLKFIGDDLDQFYQVYVRLLAKRLLLDISNEEDEIWLFSIIKREFKGVMFDTYSWFKKNKEFVKIETMIKNLNTSKEITRKFHEKQIQSKSFDVKVVESYQWNFLNPESIAGLTPHPFFKVHHARFEEFFHSIHENKKLKWVMGGINTVKIFGRFRRGDVTVTTNGIQAMILDLFNDQSVYTLDELKVKTGIDDEGRLLKYLERVASEKYRVVGLKRVHVYSSMLILKTEEQEQEEGVVKKKMVLLNEDYYGGKKRKWDVRSPRLSNHEFTKMVEQQDVDRMVQVKAALVRVMKKKKRVKENEIFGEVIEQVKLFRPGLRMIEEAITELMSSQIIAVDVKDVRVLVYVTY